MIRRRYLRLLGLAVLLVWFFWPVSKDFLDFPYSTVVNDKYGDLLSATIAHDEQWRFPIINSVPERFAKAIITYEDKRFYGHPGIDFLALGRAVVQNIKARTVVSGASTLTMQLARLRSGGDRTIWQKVKEMRTAMRLELWHSKKEILSWYTSLAPFGGNVVGLEAACWRYYHKSPDRLSWAEAATLAVLPNAPSLIHVNRNRDRLLKKRDFLLQALMEEGHIDAIDLEAALAEPLPSEVYPLPQFAPHLLTLQRRLNKKDQINLSIDPELQSSTAAVMNRLYQEWQQNDINNAGCIVLDTKTGEILAYHGNIPHASSEGSVDVVQARRSSGSILKPFLYAHMLEEELLTPQQLVWDIPTFISGFHPSNYNKKYSGAVAADVALQSSLNVPFVRMLQTYGISPFLHRLKGHGLTTLYQNAEYYGLSLILGGGEVTLWELAHAYRELGQGLLTGQEVSGLSPATIYTTLQALTELNRPNEEGDWQRIQSRAPLAWKTGTSYGHRDAWAVGVHPEVTIGVWVGNADGEGREGIIGSKTAGRLLFSVLGKINLSKRWFDEPLPEMKYLRKCKHTGMLASVSCPDVEEVLWPENIEGAEVCKYHHVYAISPDGAWHFDGDCYTGDSMYHRAYLGLPATVAQYYKRRHPDWSPVPPLHPDCHGMEVVGHMDIIYPRPNEDVYLPKDLNADQQTLVVRVAHIRQDAKLFWYLDDNFMGETRDMHSYSFLPEEGEHLITVVDDSGYRLSRRVKILRS